MIQIDKEDLYEKIDVYLYGDIEWRDKEIHQTALTIWEKMTEAEENYFFNGEIGKVLDFFSISEEDKLSDPDVPSQSPLAKVKKDDAAFIAMHFGFLYGLIFSEMGGAK